MDSPVDKFVRAEISKGIFDGVLGLLRQRAAATELSLARRSADIVRGRVL